MSAIEQLSRLPHPYQDMVRPCLTFPSLKYDFQRTIFQHFKCYLKEIPVFNSKLKEIGFCTGGVNKMYAWEDPLRFHPHVWFELLMGMSKDELEKAALISNAEHTHPQFLAFARNILAIRDGRPIQQMPPFYYEFYEDDFWIEMRPYTEFLIFDSRGADFLKVIPKNRLFQRLQEMREYLANVACCFDNLPAVQEILKEIDTSESRSFSDWLELQFGFTKSGHPRERHAQMQTGASSSWVMEAIALLNEFQDEKALEYIRVALKAQEKSGRTFPFPFENFIYGLILWRCRNFDGVNKQLISLSKLRKLDSQECLPLKIWVKSALEDEVNVALPTSFEYGSFPRKLGGLVVLALKALKLKVDVPGNWQLAYEECRSMPWFAYETDALQTRQGAGYDEARKQLGIHPLLPLVATKPDWQKQLEYIIGLQIADEAKVLGVRTSNAEKEILACLVDRKSSRYDVTLSLRKTKDDEHFSKGKTASVVSLTRGRISQATAQDRSLVSLAEDDYTPFGTWGKVLQGAEVLHALIGHPYIFDSKAPDHRLSVQRVPLQISVKTEKNGCFRLTSNVPGYQVKEEWRYFVCDDGHDTIGIIEPSNAQRKLLKSFSSNDSSKFPAEAADLLKTLLEKLSFNTTVASDLLRDSDKLEHVAGDPKTVFRIEPSDDGFAISALVRPVPDHALTVTPGRGQPSLALSINGKPVQIDRDTLKEGMIFATLEQKLSALESCRTSDFTWSADTENCLKLLSVVRDESERAVVEWPKGEPFRLTRKRLDLDVLRLSSRCLGQWFEIEGEIRLDRKTVLSITQLLEMLRNSVGGFIRLSDKEFVELSSALKARLTALSDAVSKKPGRSNANTVDVSVFRADVFNSLERDGFQIEADEASRSLLRLMSQAKHYDPVVPKTLKAELRDYQIEGYKWMARLAAWGAGAILADDMGLGKTVQTIALLLERAVLGPQLVVMPTAVLVNWERELARFAPSVDVRVFNNEDRSELVKSLMPNDVVLTSYGVLASEIELLNTVEWKTVVLDEAHAVKNRTTKTSKAVMSLSAECRVLLTGTPLQNRLAEIWNLFQFANPGLLGTYDDFGERYILPIEVHQDKNVQRKLKRVVSPFILRRTKAEVLDELPEKTELTVQVTLSEEEKALYETLREQARTRFAIGEINSIQALAELTKLRLAACHPELVNPKLQLFSSKTAAFVNLVYELMENGHRALVFSQFTTHLALIKRELDARGIDYLYLDGSDTPSRRSQLVDEFQHGDKPLFLISLKAGGTGLNLTAADYVIHLDPWWNPAVEDQASDRAYRIGQDRPVTIYRLISEGTIEEKILRLHETKKSLADALLEGTDMSNRLSKDEILQLLAED